MSHAMTPGVEDTLSISVPPGQTLATPAATAALQTEVAAVTGQPAPAVNPATGRLFTEEEMAAARRQEKDKLYPKMTELEQRLAVFEQERAEAQARAEAAAAQEAEERRRREEAEMSAHDLVLKKEDELKAIFNTAQAEWEQKFLTLQAESEARAELLDRERRFQELQTYKNRRIQEEEDNLMPELLDLITGNTPEEIDAAILTVAAKTSAILANMPQPQQQQQRPRGISATGGPPSGPLENSMEQQTLSLDALKSMTMDEYAQIRDRLITANSRR